MILAPFYNYQRINEIAHPLLLKMEEVDYPGVQGWACGLAGVGLHLGRYQESCHLRFMAEQKRIIGE